MLTVHEQTELDKHIAAIRDAIPHVERGMALLQTVARHLYEIRALQLCGSLDELCQREFAFSGSWGSRLADWYAVRRTLAASLPDGERSLGAMDFLNDFNESCAREIKHLAPAQQVEAWEKAKETGERPTARLLARIAARFNVSPDEIEAMTLEEQRQRFRDLDAAIAEDKRVEAACETARLTIKRNRKVLESMKAEPMFAAILPLVERAVEECEQLRVRLEEPLFRIPTAEEKLAAALSDAEADRVAEEEEGEAA